MVTYKEWTDDRTDMGADYYWKGPDSPGQQMAKSFNLKSPEPILGATARSSNALFVFESEGECYIWNMAEDSVWRITKPSGKDEIKNQISAGGMKSLEIEELE